MRALMPGCQMLTAKDFKVDMLHLDIADKNIAEGRLSHSEGMPLSIDFNISTGEARLADGYHRYLQSRGGSLEQAMAQSRAGEFPDFYVNVSLVKNEPRPQFGYNEVKLTATETKDYIAQFIGDSKTRLGRAKAQGFDVEKVWYHGTTPFIGEESFGVDIDAFSSDFSGWKYNQDKEGFFFIDNTRDASTYASSDALGRTVDGGAIYPARLKITTPLVIDEQFCEDNNLPSINDNDVIGFWDENHKALLAYREAHDAIILKNKEGSVAVVFEPKNIRSIYASFRPEDINSEKILGHDYRSATPPKRKRTWVLTNEEFERIPELENVWKSDLPLVQKCTASLAFYAPFKDYLKKDKLEFFAHVNSTDFEGMGLDDKCKSVAQFMTGLISEMKKRTPVINESALDERSPRLGL